MSPKIFVPVVPHNGLHQLLDIPSLVLDQKVKDDWIQSCKNECNNAGCSIYPSKCRLVGVSLEVEELQAAGQANCEVLVENERIEKENWPVFKYHTKMSKKQIVVLGLNFAEQAVEYHIYERQYRERHPHIVNMPKECYILEVVLILGRSIVIQVFWKGSLPIIR